MNKISVTLREDQVGQLSDLVGEEYADRSKAVREMLDRGFQHDEHRRELEQTEARVEDLRRQLQQANSRERDVDEIVAYVEDERELRRRREAREQRREEHRNAPVWRRAKWWLFGRSEDTAES